MNDFFTRLPQQCRHIRNLCKSTPDGQLFQMLAEETSLMAQSRPAMEREFKLPVEASSEDWRFEEGRFVLITNQPRIGVSWHAEVYRPPNSCPSNHDLTRTGCNVFVLEDIGPFQNPGVNCGLVPMLQDAAKHLDANLPGQFWDVWWAAHYRDWPWSDGWTKSSWWEKSQETKREFLNEFRSDVRRVLKTWIGWCEGKIYEDFLRQFDDLVPPKPKLSVTTKPPTATFAGVVYSIHADDAIYLDMLIKGKGLFVTVTDVFATPHRNDQRLKKDFPELAKLIIVENGRGRRINTDLCDL